MSSTFTPAPSPASSKRVVIVGAGLAGSLLACLLARDGWSVRVYEKRPDPRAKGYLGGRSINLALSARGLAGLAAAGLDKVVMQQDAIPMSQRGLHARSGAYSVQPYSSNPSDAINSVSRGGLNLTLINAAAATPGVEMYFDRPCLDVDLMKPEAVFQTPGGTERIDADLIVATDGAFSAVRLAMMKTDRFDYSQTYLGHGYKELHIPAGPGAAHIIEKNALHIWPRGGAMMIALPNRDGSFTCTLFWPFKGDHSFEALEGPHDRRAAGPIASSAEDLARVTAFFRAEYPDAAALMPTLTSDFFANPTSSLVTVRCWPWQRHGRVCLLGDAAHAIVPFYGQGMNAAFEDCVELARSLREERAQHAALERYEQVRKPSADAIADMALENFTEMRDLAGRPDFQYIKRIERTLHAGLGDVALPQYNLVSFSTVPYERAQAQGRRLARVYEQVASRLPADRAAAMTDAAWITEVTSVARPLL